MKLKFLLNLSLLTIFNLALTAQSQWTGTSPIYYNGGNVGIGTSTPGALLDVKGTIAGKTLQAENPVSGGITFFGHGIGSSSANLVLQSGSSQSYWFSANSFALKIGGNGGSEPSLGAININPAGRVGIGTIMLSDPNYKLFVETGIRTRRVQVDLESWPDYVFSTNYKLRPLSELEKFIKENSHLPGVPPASEITSNGLNLGEAQKILMEKIEELTLYIINQQKEIDELRKQMAEK